MLYCARPLTYLLCVLLIFVASLSCAQLPSCTGSNIIYYAAAGGVIYNYDPSLPPSATNPSTNTIALPLNASIAIAVSQNLNGGSISPTFYTVLAGGNYGYYDGAAGWVNTGHNAGSINIGGGGSYLYGLSGTGVTRYDGTGPPANVSVFTTYNGIADVQADVNGFYLLRTDVPLTMNLYSPTGILLQTWTLTGVTPSSGGGGFGIIGNKVYFNNSTGFREGTISGSNINFTTIIPGGLSPGPGDFAVCQASLSAQPIYDTITACADVPVTLTAAGPGPYNWSVLSGPATINGTGSSVIVTTNATASISRNTSATIPPTTRVTRIMVPSFTVDAGTDDSSFNCSGDWDTVLHGSIAVNPANTSYSLAWAPTASILANGTTLTPSVRVAGTQSFVLSATLPGTYGCTVQDTVVMKEVSVDLHAAFTVDHDSICVGNPVNFINSTTANIVNGSTNSCAWDFGDGTASTQINPIHAYTLPGTYTVRLSVKSSFPCFDTAYHIIVVDSLPDVSITLSDTVVCAGERMLFTASYNPGPVSSVTWDFGDNSTLTGGYLFHAYNTSGYYKILINADYRNCPDAEFSRYVRVKRLPLLDLGADMFLCPNGQPIRLVDAINENDTAARFLWNTGATTPSIIASKPDGFDLVVTIDGCESRDSINVLNDCYLNIPNSFTPNGDGLNDFFFPKELKSHSIIGFKMSIYNRWGQLIYKTANIDDFGWDGKFNGTPQPTEVYVYMIEARFKDGRVEKYKGNVTLLR